MLSSHESRDAGRKPTWEFCNKTWSSDRHRVAQVHNEWESKDNYLASTAIGYDSPASAAAAFAEFRRAGSGCDAYTGPVLGERFAVKVVQRSMALPGGAGKALGVSTLVVGRLIRQGAEGLYLVDVFVADGAYVVDCVGVAGQADVASRQAGVCAGRIARRLGRA